MTELHAGGKFDQNSLKYPAACTAGRVLRERPLQAAEADHPPRRQSAHDGFRARVPQNRELETVDGIVTSPIKVIGDTDKRGTKALLGR